MINKHLLGSLFFVALAGCVAHSPPEQAADKPIVEEETKAIDGGMVLIPAGEFTMGSNKEENVAMWRDANALNPFGFNDRLYVDEHPAHKVNLADFMIDKYEVTNIQYRDFVIATQHSVPGAWPRTGYNFSNKLLAALPLEDLRQIASDRFRLDMDVTKLDQVTLLAELK